MNNNDYICSTTTCYISKAELDDTYSKLVRALNIQQYTTSKQIIRNKLKAIIDKAYHRSFRLHMGGLAMVIDTEYFENLEKCLYDRISLEVGPTKTKEFIDKFVRKFKDLLK